MLVDCSSSLLGATYCLSQRIPSTFLPVEDQGYFFVVIQLPDGASLQRTDAVAEKVRERAAGTPGVDIVGSISGLQLPDQRRAVELGRRIRDPQAVGRAAAPTDRLADRRDVRDEAADAFPKPSC